MKLMTQRTYMHGIRKSTELIISRPWQQPPYWRHGYIKIFTDITKHLKLAASFWISGPPYSRMIAFSFSCFCMSITILKSCDTLFNKYFVSSISWGANDLILNHYAIWSTFTDFVCVFLAKGVHCSVRTGFHQRLNVQRHRVRVICFWEWRRLSRLLWDIQSHTWRIDNRQRALWGVAMGCLAVYCNTCSYLFVQVYILLQSSSLVLRKPVSVSNFLAHSAPV